MPITKISSTSPDRDMDLNGLDALATALLSQPRGQHFVIGIIDCSKITTDFAPDGEVRVPTARFVQIEPLPAGRDADLGRALLDRANRMRTGRDPLPLDFGSELRKLETAD